MSLKARPYDRLVTRSLVAAAALLLVTAAASSAAVLRFQDTQMSALSGPDGALYVAKSGNGSEADRSGLSIISGNGSTVYSGMSGGISSWLIGTQERMISGLASFAVPNGSGAPGIHDVALSVATEALNAIIGFGTGPTVPSNAPPETDFMGRIVSFSGGIATAFADLAQPERSANPDGAEVNSPALSLMALPGGGFMAFGPSGNSILSIDDIRMISPLAALPTLPNPRPIGGLPYEAAPAGNAPGPDGQIYSPENGLSGADDRVIALAPVPLPMALPLMALLLASLFGVSRIRRRRS